jgi:hypothetical protein
MRQRVRYTLALLGLGRVAFHQLHWLARHNSGYGVLINELRMAITPEQDAKVVEPRHDALQFHAIHQEYSQRSLVFPNVVQKRVLEALNALGSHDCCPLLIQGGQQRTVPPTRADKLADS